jgi:hypothetical protein
MGVFAQVTGLTQVKTLRPPGAALMPSAPLVALAGDAAVTAYQGAGPQPWQVWYRYPDTAGINGWSEPTLLAEGSSVSGDQVDISANGNVIAIGSPEAAGGAGEIRMYRTTTAGMTWQLESIIPAPQGISGFGSKVMVRGDLLVEAASLTPSVHSFHFDSETQDWLPAGWAVEEIPLSFQFSVATDGERIVFCLTRCTSRVLDENGDWITEAQSDNGGVTDVQISGEWMVGGRNIYHRVGTEWLVTQSIPMVSRFVLSDDSLLVAVQGGGIEVWRNEEGTWQLSILRSGWLLTGDVLLHRKDAKADFVRVRHLERPTGLEIAGWTMAADRDTLLVAPVNSTQQLALVYRFEDASGWIPSGEVPRVPPFDDDSDTCAALTLSAGTGACLLPHYTGLHGLEMLVLRPVVDQSDWAVTESMHVDAPPYGDYSPYVMTSRGAYVALGLPSSGVGGENDDSHMAGGRVIVFLTGEAIFDNGFE